MEDSIKIASIITKNVIERWTRMNTAHCPQCNNITQDYLHDITECAYCMADLREGEGDV
jgi:hypothetical protein